MIRILHRALRRLASAPAFTIAAALTLTLGIGATAAVFTVFSGVLLRPLPYDRPGQLVDLSHTLVVSGIAHVDQSDATYLLYRRDNRVFSDVGAYQATAVNVGGAQSASGGDVVAPERLSAARVTGSLFDVLHATAHRGRALSDADGQPGATPVVVIGEEFWRAHLGADAAVIGRRIVVDGVEREVVGVMPADFHFPSSETALWLPLELDAAHTRSAAFDYRVVARLRGGTSLAAATTDLNQLLPRVPEVFPGRLTRQAIELTHMRVVVQSLRDVVVGDVSRVLWIVLGAVSVLLLIACANVANLFLARAEARQHELAIRRALGASRGTIAAEFLSEAAILATVGGALGLALAWGAVQVLQSLGTGTSIPRLSDVYIDRSAMAMTAAVSALAAMIVSALPLLRARGVSPAAALVERGRSATVGRARHRARRALVVAQVALALVLIAAAGLMTRSFARLRAVDPGFAPDHVLAFRLALPNAAYPTGGDAARVVLRAADEIAALPGVQAAGVVSKLPLDEESRQDSAVFVEDHPLQPGDIPNVHEIVFVTPDYFRAMGIPLLAGRLFDKIDAQRDPATEPREVVVSDAFANRYWKGRSPVGKRVRMNAGDPWSVVVGVVRGVRDVALDQSPSEVVYSPLLTSNVDGVPWAPHDVAVVVRATGDAARLAAASREVVHRLDPSLPIFHVVHMSDLVSRAAARTTLTLFMLGAAAVVAMLIGGMGIYGVIAYLLSLRTREIGVRLALGAQPSDVRRLVAGQTLLDAMLGIAIGLIVAATLTRILSSLLFDVSPLDPISLVGAAGALLVVAIAASWLPARRAAALDPVRALRAE